MRRLFFAITTIVIFMLYLATFASAQTNRDFRAKFAPFHAKATGARLMRITPTASTVIPDVLAVQGPCPSPEPGVLCATFSTLASPGDTIRFRLCQSNSGGEACTGCNCVEPCDYPDRYATLPTPSPTGSSTPTRTPSRTPTPTPTATRLAPPILHGVEPVQP